ncbi:MAG: hypothetical protein LBV61_05075 [Burkholderiaceae bacterium]|jgi:predicted outer membrane protein|nr:hypothetical protein [Burkholderiaceae bacterium]
MNLKGIQMNAKIITVAALSLLTAVAASAETSFGVDPSSLPLAYTSTASRANVEAGAVARAHSSDWNINPSSRVLAVKSTANRADVEAGAVAQAHSSDWNINPSSRVLSSQSHVHHAAQSVARAD